MTYQEAYAETIANINDQMDTLQQTLLSLQYRLDLPKALWTRPPLKLNLATANVTQQLDLFVEAQTKFVYLTQLLRFIEQDQLRTLRDPRTDFFEKRDLYWWQSTLSLVGNPASLAHELIADGYYDLAKTSAI